jgi:serine/threonine protein kinase
MDRLYDTLERRIQKVWLPKSKSQNSFFGKNILDRKGTKRDELLETRIVFAYDLSAAINYLHQRKILYRDIKPENIGFDVRDDIKLFDFGLAKELKDDMQKENGLYHLTADTGSPRYMAPGKE